MQEIVVAIVVMSAACYVGWQVWLTLFSQSKTSCGSACQTCPSGKAKSENGIPLVTLELNANHQTAE